VRPSAVEWLDTSTRRSSAGRSPIDSRTKQSERKRTTRSHLPIPCLERTKDWISYMYDGQRAELSKRRSSELALTNVVVEAGQRPNELPVALPVDTNGRLGSLVSYPLYTFTAWQPRPDGRERKDSHDDPDLGADTAVDELCSKRPRVLSAPLYGSVHEKPY
jgi:hypothetical protein